MITQLNHLQDMAELRRFAEEILGDGSHAGSADPAIPVIDYLEGAHAELSRISSEAVDGTLKGGYGKTGAHQASLHDFATEFNKLLSRYLEKERVYIDFLAGLRDRMATSASAFEARETQNVHQLKSIAAMFDLSTRGSVMAQRWYEDDPSGPVENLDPIFRDGYAPALHGMLKALSVVTDEAPVWGPVWVQAEDLIFEPTEMPSTENDPWMNPADPRAGAVHVNLYPILQGSAHGDGSRDLSVDEFFSHAEILTGQDIGRVAGKPGQRAEALRFEGQGEGEGGTGGGWIREAVSAIRRSGFSDAESLQYNKLDRLQPGSAWWMEHWTGPPGSVPADARARCSIIDNWQLERRRPALGVLSDYLVRFGTIIHGARFNLNSLMGACVEQLEKVDATSEVNRGLLTGWKFFSGIAGVQRA
ncbi:hypothetical protein ACPZ19_44725 [Amycolatopsis lurida]